MHFQYLGFYIGFGFTWAYYAWITHKQFEESRQLTAELERKLDLLRK